MNQTETKFEDIPTPRIVRFLKSHECGNRPIDNYGDDWAHYDIESLVDLAKQLERELHIAKESLKAHEADKARLDWMDKNRTDHIYEHFEYNLSNACNEKTWRIAIDTAMQLKDE